MTDHPLTETAAAEITDEMRHAAASAYEDMAQVTRPENHEKCLNAALEAVLAVATPTDPHHDPRPWQDCTVGDICAGDLVEARVRDTLRTGVAHHQDEDGDWQTKDGYLLIWGDHYPFRRIPAPTPPAEEVELPTEFGVVITDVEDNNGSTYDRMVFDGTCYCRNDTARVPQDVWAFTLPDGTRARRDGEREDGKPRFTEVQEEEK